MFHLTNAIPIVGAVVLIFGVGLIVRALLANFRKESAPFLNYFGAEYERDLLRQSAFSDPQKWRADDESRSRASGSFRRDRDSN